MAWCVMRSLLCSCMAAWWLHTTHNKQHTTHSGGCCYGLWSRPHDYTHHIGDVAGSAMRTALCNCQYSLLMVELADSNSRRRLLGLRREVAPVQAAARRRWRRTRRAARPPPLAPAASLRPHHHAHAGVRPSDSPRSVLASRPPLCPSTRRLSARRAPHPVCFFGG